MGDLAEEYALRAKATSASESGQWYLRQLCASAGPLLWSRLARSTWITTLGVALCAYSAVGIVEVIVHWAIASRSATGTAAYEPLGMIATFPMVVLIGYFAARFRRSAAMVLGAIMLLNVTAMMLWSAEAMPRWYRIAYFVVGPAATLIGAFLRPRLPQQSGPSGLGMPSKRMDGLWRARHRRDRREASPARRTDQPVAVRPP
jgi:hypothetical protein